MLTMIRFRVNVVRAKKDMTILVRKMGAVIVQSVVLNTDNKLSWRGVISF